MVKPVDYCTAWPDGIPTWLGGTGFEWSHCCAAHDQFYVDNVSNLNWFEYLGSHWELCQCVVSAGSCAMAGVMLVGLSTFLFVHWLSSKNKHKPGSPDKKDR